VLLDGFGGESWWGCCWFGLWIWLWLVGCVAERSVGRQLNAEEK
jgi:hypothetical protein